MEGRQVGTGTRKNVVFENVLEQQAVSSKRLYPGFHPPVAFPADPRLLILWGKMSYVSVP